MTETNKDPWEADKLLSKCGHVPLLHTVVMENLRTNVVRTLANKNALATARNDEAMFYDAEATKIILKWRMLWQTQKRKKKEY